jgi:hypothetical protein
MSTLPFLKARYARALPTTTLTTKGALQADSIAFGGPTTVQDYSVWTLADSFHPAFHVGNNGFALRRISSGRLRIRLRTVTSGAQVYEVVGGEVWWLRDAGVCD